MIDVELYSTFVKKCVCLHCTKHIKIKRKGNTITKVIGCTRFRNKPKAYCSKCSKCKELKE